MSEHSADVALIGTLVRVTDPVACVVIADTSGGDAPGKVLYQGPLIIRFAFTLLYEPDHFVPERVIDDFRRDFEGAQAYEFLIKRGDSFPRADVIGMRVSRGQYGEIFLKQLDLAAPLAAFAYSSTDADSALARVDAVIWADDTDPAWSPLDATDARCSPMLYETVPCGRIKRSHLAELRSRLRQLL